VKLTCLTIIILFFLLICYFIYCNQIYIIYIFAYQSYLLG